MQMEGQIDETCMEEWMDELPQGEKNQDKVYMIMWLWRVDYDYEE